MTIAELEDLQERIRLAPLPLIAARIKQARQAMPSGRGDPGISHDKFGALLGGVSRQHLIKLEQARHRPGAEMLTRIAEASGRDIDWFLDPAMEPNPFPAEAA